MISLSAAATRALLQQSSRPAFKVFVEYENSTQTIRRGGGTTLDLTHLVTAFPALRVSMRPTERIPDVSGITVKIFDESEMFNITNSNSVVGDNRWHRARLTVQMGVEMGQTEELTTMFVGELDDVIADLDSNLVELSFVDPIARLKGNEYGDPNGDYSGAQPTAAVESILTQAGFGGDLDVASFQAAVADDEYLNLALHRYDLGDPDNSESWWSAIVFLLGHSNRGLFWNSSGKLELFRLGPTISPPVYTFSRTMNTTKIQLRNPGGSIINRYNIFLQKPGTEEYTSRAGDIGVNLGDGYLVEDLDSIALFGTLPEDRYYAWTWGSGGSVSQAFNQASLLLDVTALAPKIFDVEATLETFVVEMWDYVRVWDSVRGIDLNGFVYKKEIDYERARCRFRIMHLPLNQPDPEDPTLEYLQTNNNQAYDDGIPILGQEGLLP